MSTMYSRSVTMLSQAKNALLSVQEDDAFLDVACFETQEENNSGTDDPN